MPLESMMPQPGLTDTASGDVVLLSMGPCLFKFGILLSIYYYQ